MIILRQKSFSDNKKYKKIPLKDIESDKGLKRSILLSPIDGGGGLIGGYRSKKAANKADEGGESDDIILKKAKSAGLKSGIIPGAVGGAIWGGTLGSTAQLAGRALFNTGGRMTKADIAKNAIKGAVIGSAVGALGGRNAASVNAKERLNKRASKERDINKDK